MPLQDWMTEHGHPGWYSWLVVIGGSIVSMVVAVGISVGINERSLERDRAAREAGRAATCLVIKTMVSVYTDPAPLTVTGEKAAAAWDSLGRIFGCKE